MQRLCVADFKHPCLKLWAFNFGHPCPSLVKGEVLSPEKNRATTGGIAFLPHPFRFSDTSVNNPSIVGSASHCNRSSPLYKGAKGDSALPTLPNPHYPTLSTTFLAPLPKGAGLRQGTNCRFVAFLLAIHPPFLFTKLFAVKTEGLLYAHQPLNPHNLLKSTSTASPRTMSLPPLSKVRCCRPKKFGRLPEGLPHNHPFHNLTPHFPIIHRPTFISSLYTLDNFRR